MTEAGATPAPAETLGAAFRQRAHALWHSGGRLRAVTAVAVGELLATTLLAFTAALPMPRVPVSSSYGHLVTVGGPIYLVCVVLLSIAWGYLLTGAVHARWPVHLLGMVVFTITFLEPIGSLELVPALLAVAVVLLAATWAIGFSHRLLRRDRGLGLALPAVHTALVLALYADCYLGAVASGSGLLFGFALSIQLAALEFVLIPVVFLAGTDFSEWGEVAGTWLAEVIDRIPKRGPAALASATVLVAVATVADALRQHGAAMAGQAAPLVLAVLLVAGLAAAGRTLSHRRPVRLPLGAQVLGAIGFFLSLTVAFLAVAAGTLKTEPTVAGFTVTRYDHRSDPVFSIQAPALWERSEATSPFFTVSFDGTPVGNAGRFVVVSAPAGSLGPDAMVGWVAAGQGALNAETFAATADGGWTVRPLRVTMTDGSLRSGHAWQRDDGGRTWLVYGISGPTAAGLDDPLYAALVPTWRPDIPATAASPSDTNALLSAGAIPWAVALVVLAAWLRWRPKLRAGLATGALFLGLIAILYVTSQLGPILQSLRAPLHLDGLRETGLQSGIAVGALALAIWAAAARRLQAAAPVLALVLTLMVGLQVISWVFALFDLKNQAFTVVQAALIAAALAWDVIMSGGSIAQGHGRWFPRHSRVLIYFGYDMLVATAVLFFAALRDQVTGGTADTGFSTDFWVQNGLLMLGMPMLVCLFLVKLGRLRTAE